MMEMMIMMIMIYTKSDHPPMVRIDWYHSKNQPSIWGPADLRCHSTAGVLQKISNVFFALGAGAPLVDTSTIPHQLAPFQQLQPASAAMGVASLLVVVDPQ